MSTDPDERAKAEKLADKLVEKWVWTDCRPGHVCTLGDRCITEIKRLIAAALREERRAGAEEMMDRAAALVERHATNIEIIAHAAQRDNSTEAVVLRRMAYEIGQRLAPGIRALELP